MKRLFIIALIAFAGIANAETYSGRVVGVTDGDTITVLTGGREQKIRLADIDAPESGQPFGSAAKQSLSGLVFGKEVTISGTSKDRYGRLIGRVHVGPTDVNLELVKQGMAWAYREYTHDAGIISAESRARVQAIGIWSIDDQTPPWEWRHGGAEPTKPTPHVSETAKREATDSSSRSLDGYFAGRDFGGPPGARGGESSALGTTGYGISGSYGGSQQIHTGPRGGHYVITDGGNKRYVGKGK